MEETAPEGSPRLDPARLERSLLEPIILAPDGGVAASVAMILHRQSDDLEVLFIERAQRDGDPWSGHMAFPGGRTEPEDEDARATAERETGEELGLDLAAARWLGRLDDQEGRRAGGSPRFVISAFVYLLDERPPLRPNSEVEETIWFPLHTLLEESVRVRFDWPAVERDFPGLLVGEPERHVVWGLTYRFLQAFFARLGHRLP